MRCTGPSSAACFLCALSGVRVRVGWAPRIPRPHLPVCSRGSRTIQQTDDAPRVRPAHHHTAIAILLKKSLFAYPSVWTAFHLGTFISRGDRSKQDSDCQSQKASKRMAWRAIVFDLSEGTRSPDGRLQKFKKGAVVMAIKAGLPIVPIGVFRARNA